MLLSSPAPRLFKGVLCACLCVLAAPEGRAQTPTVANRPLPDLARDLLDGTLTRGEAEPDTVPPWRYLPLAVGNAWEYETWFGHARIDIPKDTLINGRRYFLWDERQFGKGANAFARYRPPIRYDTLSARVVEDFGDGSGNEVPFLFAPCPLDVPFDSTVECFKGDFRTVSGTYDGVLDFEPDTTVTDVAVKTYASKFDINRLAAGFGRALYEEFVGGWYYALRYARIDGETFGQELFPVASEEAPANAEALRLEAWPNPYRERLTVSLTLGRPQRVVLEVVDVLGRIVARRNLGALSAGRHEVALDASGWGAGTYFVRIEAEVGARSVRAVTRLR